MELITEINDQWPVIAEDYAGRAWPIDIEDDRLVVVCDSEHTANELAEGGFGVLAGLARKVPSTPGEMRLLGPGEAIPRLAQMILSR